MKEDGNKYKIGDIVDVKYFSTFEKEWKGNTLRRELIKNKVDFRKGVIAGGTYKCTGRYIHDNDYLKIEKKPFVYIIRISFLGKEYYALPEDIELSSEFYVPPFQANSVL